jgi:hypothetical protein
MSAQTPEIVLIELRCPVGPRKLLAKIRRAGEPIRVTDGNLMELACRDCSTTARRAGHPPNTRVIHRFNLLGELVESVAERF